MTHRSAPAKSRLSLPLLLGCLALSACAGDETLSAYAPEGAEYRLVEVDGAAFPARATLRLGANGAVSGEAPCNGFSTRILVPYPWFELGPIAATRRACPELEAETAFFAALSAMTISEASGPVLILSNTDGGQMVFEARQHTLFPHIRGAQNRFPLLRDVL